MVRNLINLKPNWFLTHKRLLLLGFFQLEKYLKYDNPLYNSMLVFHSKVTYFINPLIFIRVMKKIYPLIANIVLNSGIFFFFSLGETGLVFFNKFFTLLKKSKVDVVFDWGFGVLTNRVRMYFNCFLEGKFSFEEFPEIAFLLSILGRQKVITTELRRGNILSIGLVEYGDSGCVDYPLAAKASSEYVYILFRLMATIIVKEQKELRFYNSTMVDKKLKKRKNTNKLKKFKKLTSKFFLNLREKN
jgi:hypothetical protein